MKKLKDIAERIAADTSTCRHETDWVWQKIDLEMACYEMARQIQRWIPVEEELPIFDNTKYPNGDYEQYFVKMSTGGMSPTTRYAVSHLTNNTRWNCEHDWNTVTHWRPIEYK